MEIKMSNENSDHKIPDNHPRYLSLKYRQKIVEGMIVIHIQMYHNR